MKKKFKFTYNWALVLVCLVLFIAFFIPNHKFLNLDSLKLTVEIAIMALPMTMLIIMGCIDFSLCAIATLSAALGGIVYSFTHMAALGLLVSLAVGAACGAFNGFMVSRLKLPPLITTLATMYLYKGIAKAVTLGSGYGTNVAETPVAHFLGGTSILIPTQLWLLVIMAVILNIVLSKTVYGRTLYAIGLNENATRFAGINVTMLKFLTYVMAGMIFAIAGQVLMGRFSTVQYDSADSYQMRVIIVCVLGGANMNGGRGTIGGTLLGTAVLTLLISGMNGVALPDTQQKIVLGMVLLISLISFQLIAEHDLKVKGQARIAAAEAENAAKTGSSGVGQ